MLAAAHIDTGRIGMHDLQRLPVHFLRDRPLLFACRVLLVHAFSSFHRKWWTRPGSDSSRENFPTGSDPSSKTATDRQTNIRDRRKTGAMLLVGYRTPVCGRP